MGVFSALHQYFRYLNLRWNAFLMRSGFRLSLFFDKRPKFSADRTIFIDGAGGKRRIKLNIYEPSTPSSKAGVKPVHINWHGSGFMLPMQGSDDRFCRLIADRLGCIVVDGDYRKAPEYPFPGGYEDVARTVEWVQSNINNQFDTSKISVGGFSAGASLALAVTAQYPGVIKAVTAFYPMTTSTSPYSQKKAPPVTALDRKEGRGMVIPPQIGDLFHNAYLFGIEKRGLTAADPRCSVLCANPADFPDKQRTLVVVAEYDYLAAEAVEFAEKLRQAGREPVEYEVKGMGHAWDKTASEGTEASQKRDKAYELAVEVLQRAYAD